MSVFYANKPRKKDIIIIGKAVDTYYRSNKQVNKDVNLEGFKEEQAMSYMSNEIQGRAGYDSARTETVSKENKTKETRNTSKINGRVIGNPQLSEKAAKYYAELKKKYSNMEFVLVSEDRKEMAKAQAGSYANANKMVVLIDEAKVEQMATDEAYRNQYEGIIANAASGLSQLASSLSTTGANVKGYGVQINDNGTASYFAVLDKLNDTQKERIAKKAEQKKAAKKAEAKREKQKTERERLEQNRQSGNQEDVITASSMEELIQKVQDWVQAQKSDDARTESEKKLGQQIDYSV